MNRHLIAGQPASDYPPGEMIEHVSDRVAEEYAQAIALHAQINALADFVAAGAFQVPADELWPSSRRKYTPDDVADWLRSVAGDLCADRDSLRMIAERRVMSGAHMGDVE